jgi:putative transposase
MTVFHDDEDRLSYLKFMAEETERFGVEILSWCLMTNHVHFIAVPEREESLARAIGEAHRKYTRMKNFSEGVRGYLFQGRFGSSVLDERHLIAAARYVEMNPVRAKIIKLPWEYPWSSAAYHAGLQESDPLVKDKTLRGLVKEWQEYLFNGEGKEEELRLATRTGRPAGDERFVSLIEERTGRDLSKGRPGRPGKRG